MLIVLEGCDGAGKSYLAEILSKIMDAEVIHCTAETANDFGFFYNLIQAGDDRNIIADRFCYGQFVYQKKEDRKLDQSMLNELETEMLNHGVSVVYVTASPETIVARLEERGEIPAMPVEDILGRYEKLFQKRSIMPIKIYATD